MSRSTVVGLDLDGTLFDHEEAARRAIGRFLAERGWPAPSTVGEDWLALEDVHFGDHAAGLIDFEEQRRRRMSGLLKLIGVDDSDAYRLYLDYLPHYQDSWLPYVDVVPALDELQRMGLRLAVLTNGNQGQQVAKLERMGILDRFEVVLAASQLPAFKPSPLAFAALCESMDAKADSVVYVGDDLLADVGGAQRAGLKPVWIDRVGGGGAPAGVAAVMLLTQLPALVK